MKLTSTLAVFALCISIFCTQQGFSQTQFNPKVGFTSWSIQDELAQSGKSNHSGQTIGFDMFIVNNRFLFVPGFHYHRISILNEEDGFIFKLPKRNGAHYFSIPLTFGIQVLDLKILDFSIRAGGQGYFFHSLDSNDIGLDDDKIYGVFASLTGAAQVEVLGFLTLDVKYNHALHPSIKSRPESKVRGWELSAGVKF